MKRYYFLALFCLIISTQTSQAQSVWDGGGDGTSWNDALNWVNDVLPANNDIVEFKTSATVKGTNAKAAQIKLSAKAKVEFLLNLDLGNGVIDQHAFILGNLCQLKLGNDLNSFNFNLSPFEKKNGISVIASADSTRINIGKLSIVRISNGLNGINIVNKNAIIQNDGLIKIDSTVGNGIKLSGAFINNGNIEISEVRTDGINVNRGTFTNNKNANITVNGAREDGIDIVNFSSFVNESNINITSSSSAAIGNVGISIASIDSMAQFVNKGTINLNGNTVETARSIFIDEKGTLINEKSIFVQGGSPTASIYSRGNITNAINAKIEFKAGRFNINKGTLLNLGYIKSNYTAAGIFADTLTKVENKAFYRYLNANKFASGKGDIIDNGLNAKDSSSININAKGSCSIFLTEASYPWYEGSKLIGNTSAQGNLELQPKSVEGRPLILHTVFDSIEVSISNYCPEANIDGGISPEDSLYVWDGNGDGTSWHDSLNWDTNKLPKDGAFIEFNNDAVITGESKIKIANLKIAGKANVVLDLDLNIGDAIVDQNAINIGSNCTLQFGQGSKNININLRPTTNKNGINIAAISENCNIIIRENVVVNLMNGANGVNLASPNSSFTSSGKIIVTNDVKTGIKSSGKFTNTDKGTIEINQSTLDGISINGGSIVNDGTISIAKTGDDCIEINNAELINNGTISIALKDDATFANGGIIVDSIAAFTNESSGKLVIQGGMSASARSIIISEFGGLANLGSINIEGGNVGSAIFVIGNLLNSKGGILDMKDGRINVKEGNLDNSGYIKSGFSGAGILSDTLAIVNNYGFFQYINSGIFAAGKGTVIDTGLNVTKPINAKKACSIDLGEVSYPWETIEGMALGNSNDNGTLMFAAKSLLSDSIEIKTVYDFKIKVTKICEDAVKTSAINNILASNNVVIMPNIVSNGILHVEFNNELEIKGQLVIIDNNGIKVNTMPLDSYAKKNDIDITTLPNGLYHLLFITNNNIAFKKFIKL